MNAEKIICSLNDMRDDYVMEYAEKSRPRRGLRAWGVAAACLALAVLCVPLLTRAFDPSEGYDRKGGARYEFESYSELCDVLPEGNILANIPNSDKGKIIATVECPEGTTDFDDYNDFSYLYVDVHYDDGTGVSVFCVVKSKKTAKEDIDVKPLQFPPEKVSMTTISGCDIYSSSYEEGDSRVVVAEFSLDGSLYKLSTTTLSQEKLIQYIGDLLDR